MYWSLHSPPFPLLRKIFGTARSSQGRAVGARRSEPLTARTVPESWAGRERGRGSQGVSPWRGSGAAPRAPYRALFARQQETCPLPSVLLRRPTGGARSPAFVAASLLRPGFHPHSCRPVPRPGARWGSLLKAGCCHLSVELGLPVFPERSLYRDLAVTRTRSSATTVPVHLVLRPRRPPSASSSRARRPGR